MLPGNLQRFRICKKRRIRPRRPFRKFGGGQSRGKRLLVWWLARPFDLVQVGAHCCEGQRIQAERFFGSAACKNAVESILHETGHEKEVFRVYGDC
jgi:hypothetical protein